MLRLPNPKGRHSRFAAAKKCITDLWWGFDGLRTITDFGLVSVGDSWERLKERSLMFYHATKLRALALRRPRVYEGLETIDTKQHERLLKKVHPYHAAVLIKVWTGAAMTGAHRKTIFPEHDDTCECGYSPQSLHHLLYHCPLSPPPLPHIERWGREQASKAVALLCPKHLGPEGVKTWEDTCMRAVRAISRISVPVDSIDWKGHEISVSECKSIVYCGKCWVARKTRDMKYLPTKPCPRREEVPCWNGDYIVINGHVARCQIATWKRAGLRPRFSCVACALEWWPEFPPSLRCDARVML